MLWLEHPDEPFMATLMFRVGAADETVSTHGLSHIVEHLALFSAGEPGLDFNGFVDLLRTVFYVRAEPGEAVEFLQRVARALGELPLDRLENEKRVLRTEAEGSGASVDQRLLTHRFGGTGFGVSAYDQLGLRSVGPDQVAAWAREHFTRENALIWMTGPPPDGLELELPSGSRRPPPPIEPLPDLEYPVHIAEGSGGVAIASLLPRSTANRLGLGIMGERAHSELRLDQAMSYGVDSPYEPLNATTAHALLIASCLDDHSARVRDELMRVVRAIAEDGATDDELARARRLYAQALKDQEPPSRLDYECFSEFLGSPAVSEAELLAESEAVTGADVAACARSFLEQAVAVVPAATPMPRTGWHAPPDPATDRVEGREWTTKGLRRGRRTTIVVGPDALGGRWPEGPSIAIRFADVVAAIEEAGEMTIIARDESFVSLPFRQFRDGDGLREAILAALPEGVHVPDTSAPRTEALLALANERLKRRWTVKTELEWLPRVLAEDESVTDLAEATVGRVGLKAGLLALTDRRIVFLTPVGDDNVTSFYWEEIEEIKGRSLVDATLTIRARGEKFSFTSVEPSARAKEFARAAEALMAGGPSPSEVPA